LSIIKTVEELLLRGSKISISKTKLSDSSQKIVEFKPSLWWVVVCAIFFLTAYFLGADFGKFKPDYYQAHSLAMIHLHQDGGIFQLLRTIPNSASGVLPLWLYGFVQGFELHKFFSLCTFLCILIIVWRVTDLNEFGRYFLMALLISPMIISATAWVLPEIFALLILILIYALSNSYPVLAVVLSALVPFCRQTFIAPLFGRLLFWPKNLMAYFAMGLVAFLGMVVLVYIWGGLVPPNLMAVHLTPSLKSPIVALLIFSLYFFQQNVMILRTSAISTPRFLIAIAFSALLVTIGLAQPPLLGGGFIFSRIEAYNLVIAWFFEVALLTLFFCSTMPNTIAFFTLASISFGTTNYMFLKYVDFYFFAFLAYGLSDINKQFKTSFAAYSRSGFVFEFFSISAAIIFYLL